MNTSHLITVFVATIVLMGVCIGPAAAAENQDTTSESGEDSGGDLALGNVVEGIEDLISDFDEFSSNWGDTLEIVLISVLFDPFQALLKQLVTVTADVLTHAPAIHPNTAVEEIHRLTLLVTVSLSGLAFTVTGLLYMIGPVIGVSYSQVRQILPRLILALVFATISLPLLQYGVDLSNVLSTAFMPDGLDTSLQEIAGTSATLVLVYLINSWLLLAVVVLFVVRDVYILFTAAISPLLALAWALPKTKRYADSFIAGFWTALAMGPLDMLVLKFSFALLKGNGATLGQNVSNWIYGIASFVLLLWVPYQLYGASQAAVGQAYNITRGVKTRVRRHKRKRQRQQYREKQLRALRNQQHRRPRRRRHQVPQGGHGGDDF